MSTHVCATCPHVCAVCGEEALCEDLLVLRSEPGHPECEGEPQGPTYEELATAFWEYLAATSNDGAAVLPEEADIEAAHGLLERTGVTNPYPGWPA